jgi:hypothetical protein
MMSPIFAGAYRTVPYGGQEVDGLVILTACYFHDIVSLAMIRSGH